MASSCLLAVKTVILRAENDMTTNNANHKDLRAHGAMLLAMVLFGLMATFSKDVLTRGGITGPQLVAFRVIGAALLFWLGSLVVPQQRIERRDMFKIAGD